MQPFDSKWILEDESVKNIPCSMLQWKQQPPTVDDSEENNITRDRLLAVLYTSGSTGKPKGARILHSGAINRLEWQWNEFPYQNEDICLFKVIFFLLCFVINL